jgi:lipopolysaccharide transport system ATP-binding protein
MSPVIKVENLSKRYFISHQKREPYLALRDVVATGAKRFGNRLTHLFSGQQSPSTTTREEFWALKNVNFELSQGKSLGIIGRNGAGKSTLLKILSRITEPTAGRITLRGRVASLLEVGTGFHPELTGRENMFLNGSILGMSKAEIIRKFDEIVTFADIERFLDTPVKYYSSGMRVRLAFSIAAHLEPEILVVDEVLAVGDIDFQTRCLKRMETVARGGSTVLFVSHNMSAIQRLCQRTIFLHRGTIAMDGPTSSVIDAFVNEGTEEAGENHWEGDTAPTFDDGSVRLRAIRALNEANEVRSTFHVTEPVAIEVEYEVVKPLHALNVHLYFSDGTGQALFVAMDGIDSPWGGQVQQKGIYKERATIPANLFNEGPIRVLYLICCRPHVGTNAYASDALAFHITDDRRDGGARGDWKLDWPPSIVRPKLEWRYAKLDSISEARQ